MNIVEVTKNDIEYSLKELKTLEEAYLILYRLYKDIKGIPNLEFTYDSTDKEELYNTVDVLQEIVKYAKDHCNYYGGEEE